MRADGVGGAGAGGRRQGADSWTNGTGGAELFGDAGVGSGGVADCACKETGGPGGNCCGEWAGKLYGRAGGAERGEGTGGARKDSGGRGFEARGAGVEGG